MMGTYVTLFKFTQTGIKDVKNAPSRVAEGIKAVEAMGGKVTGIYLTMGEYDYVAISEWPNDEAAATFLLAWGSRGVVTSTTLKAFTMDEYKRIVAGIP
jgi:uncharacterized protein with GYD domain